MNEEMLVDLSIRALHELEAEQRDIAFVYGIL